MGRSLWVLLDDELDERRQTVRFWAWPDEPGSFQERQMENNGVRENRENVG